MWQCMYSDLRHVRVKQKHILAGFNCIAFKYCVIYVHVPEHACQARTLL